MGGGTRAELEADGTGWTLQSAGITPEAFGGLSWELLHELSCGGFCTVNTDHLDDVALYAALWKKKGIRDGAMMPGVTKQSTWL